MALLLTEDDVRSLVGPADAVEAIEACCGRIARGAVSLAARRRLPLEEGELAELAASDRELGYAAAKVYATPSAGGSAVLMLFDAATSELVAVMRAAELGRLRTGAASAVAARRLAKEGAESLGVIGCGRQAAAQVECIRAALPAIGRVVVYCRTPGALADFCKRIDAEAGESHRDPAQQDVVVTVTTSADPVLRGEWLQPGALVCAVGANVPGARELDNVVLQRASFVCCDSKEQAALESSDLVEPIELGVLDWLEVHELHEVVSGEVTGRQADDDVVVFKSNGIAAWDLAVAALAFERARERGVGATI